MNRRAPRHRRQSEGRPRAFARASGLGRAIVGIVGIAPCAASLMSMRAASAMAQDAAREGAGIDATVESAVESKVESIAGAPIAPVLPDLESQRAADDGFIASIVRILVDDVPTDVDAIRVVFERPLPAWGWFLVVAAALGIGFWSYRRLTGGSRTSSRIWRGVLAVVRAAILVLVAILIAGPSIRFERTRVERDRLVVLVDRSLSMSIKDAPGGIARDAQAAAVLEAAQPALARIARSKDIEFLGFAGGVFTLSRDSAEAGLGPDGTPAPARPVLGEPTGERTDLDTALRQSLARAAGRPVSGVLLLSDGRSASPASAEALEAFERDSVPVHAVALGSSRRLGDAAIVAVGAPGRAFVRDRVPVEVRVDRGGVEGAVAVRLVDAATGAEIARKELPSTEGSSSGETTVVLDGATDVEGSRTWRVELVADVPDLVRENDRGELTVEFVDRPLRVLYIEGTSRWEYRYLKNLLMREKDIESSIMLLSADRDFAQEGNTPIARLPRTREEFSKYDLFLIGDVPSGFLSPDQLAILRSEVADRGAGLLWIGGDRNTPSSWESTPLADLMPFKPPFALEQRVGISALAPAPAAGRLGVLRLSDEEDGWPDAFADPAIRWSKLRYVQSVPRSRVKPTAEVLATADAVGASGEEPTPAVLRMRFGAGDIVYVATDEIWRWRYGQGERLPERFWIPIVRLLARESIAQGEARAELTVAPGRLAPGRSAVVALRIVDEDAAANAPATIPVEIRDDAGEPVARIELTREGGDANAFFVPERTGRFTAVAEDPAFGRVEQGFEVVRDDDELRRGDADHAALAEIARRTGGRMLDGESVRQLAEILPLRARETDESVERTIWDGWPALAILLGLLAIEWSGRRLLRLV
jgi:hypothetical protein